MRALVAGFMLGALTSALLVKFVFRLERRPVRAIEEEAGRAVAIGGDSVVPVATAEDGVATLREKLARAEAALSDLRARRESPEEEKKAAPGSSGAPDSLWRVAIQEEVWGPIRARLSELIAAAARGEPGDSEAWQDLTDSVESATDRLAAALGVNRVQIETSPDALAIRRLLELEDSECLPDPAQFATLMASVTKGREDWYRFTNARGDFSAIARTHEALRISSETGSAFVGGLRPDQVEALQGQDSDFSEWSEELSTDSVVTDTRQEAAAGVAAFIREELRLEPWQTVGLEALTAEYVEARMAWEAECTRREEADDDVPDFERTLALAGAYRRLQERLVEKLKLDSRQLEAVREMTVAWDVSVYDEE
ncbi:MAG: hypothetical protein HYY18_05910 [Planctomycetes bacterium]|nr:hypothetical protein [Planctomycetota bacterium]